MTDQNTLDVALERIAELAGIAQRKRHGFKDTAFFALAFAEWSGAGKQGGVTPRDRKILRTIAKAALALDVALQERTHRVENTLSAEWVARQRTQAARLLAMTPERAAFLQLLAWPRLLADLAARANWRESKRGRRDRRGAPSGFRNQIVFELATGLRNAADQHGGKLTIDKTVGTGSLITALELCKPFLVSGFHIPSAMTLDRMIKKSPARVAAKTRRSKKRKSPAKKRNS